MHGSSDSEGDYGDRNSDGEDLIAQKAARLSLAADKAADEKKDKEIE